MDETTSPSFTNGHSLMNNWRMQRKSSRQRNEARFLNSRFAREQLVRHGLLKKIPMATSEPEDSPLGLWTSTTALSPANVLPGVEDPGETTSTETDS